MQNPHAVVRKSNSLIEASYKLSVNEQRLILMLVSSVRPEDREFCPYQISIKDFANLLALKNKNVYQDVEALVLGLREKTVTILRENSVLHTGWLSSIEYFSGEGTLELTFDPKLKPFLLELKARFTSYKLKMIVQLRSSFSIRIYELLKQYEKIGFRLFDLSTLREILGIGANEYPLYGNFKARVIIPAQRELKEKTDIAFDFEEIKIGRGVGKIKFKINSQTPPEAKLVNLPIPENAGKSDAYHSIKDLLEIIPIEFRTKESVKKIILMYAEKNGKEYVARNIVYANENSNAVNPGSNPLKKSNYRVYLSKALLHDYGLAYQEDQAGQQELAAKQSARIKEQSQQRQIEQTKFMNEREKFERAQTFLASLSPESLEAVRQEAFDCLAEGQKALVVRKSSVANVVMKHAMNKIVQERLKLS